MTTFICLTNSDFKRATYCARILICIQFAEFSSVSVLGTHAKVSSFHNELVYNSPYFVALASSLITWQSWRLCRLTILSLVYTANLKSMSLPDRVKRTVKLSDRLSSQVEKIFNYTRRLHTCVSLCVSFIQPYRRKQLGREGGC
jgi:hypothetical protein